MCISLDESVRERGGAREERGREGEGKERKGRGERERERDCTRLLKSH